MDLQAQRLLMAAADAGDGKTYVDDVFSTYLYSGNGGDQTINNGVNLSGKGGLTWIKNRSSNSTSNVLVDTERGVGKYVSSDTDTTEVTYNASTQNISSFTSTGFTLKNDDGDNFFNDGSDNYVSWSFRQAPGFFDIQTWTGTGVARQISHNLGCKPGMVLVRETSGSGDYWVVYHRGIGAEKKLRLNTAAQQTDTTAWNDTEPTSSDISLSANNVVNANGETYICYLFAGSESTAATARSVVFDGTGDYLSTNTSSDYTLGTNDFTLEFWFYQDANDLEFFIDGDQGTGTDEWALYITSSGGCIYRTNQATRITSSSTLAIGQWHHIAIVRETNNGVRTTGMYLNGTKESQIYVDDTDYNITGFSVGRRNSDQYYFTGKISNVRLINGTALYTTDFVPPTGPLTNITNTKALFCNNSSVTGATVGTISSSGDPTASADSPFIDTGGLVFGKNKDQNIIKCGSYIGNGDATNGLEVDVGFEPQWLLIKNADASNTRWQIFDVIRKMDEEATGYRLEANSTDDEATDVAGVSVSATGFKVTGNGTYQNTNGNKYIYMAIRRSDGYCGRPPALGSDCFQIDTGTTGTFPSYDSGFPVDFVIRITPASVANKLIYTRKLGQGLLAANQDTTAGTSTIAQWDSNVGWANNGLSTFQSLMFKRHAGLDVVSYEGRGTTLQAIRHGCGQVPEMIWIKRRDDTADWAVYHVGLTGDSRQYLILNSDASQTVGNTVFSSAPTATMFTVGAYTSVGADNATYIAYLFSSVSGISKVGSYSGSTSAVTVTTGFQPRFVIIKSSTNTANWNMYDTTRGWASGDDKYMYLNTDAAQGDVAFGQPTSTGFTVDADNALFNTPNNTYIYYCHA